MKLFSETLKGRDSESPIEKLEMKHSGKGTLPNSDIDICFDFCMATGQFDDFDNLKEYLYSWRNKYGLTVCVGVETKTIYGCIVFCERDAFGDFPFVKFLVVDPKHQKKGVGKFILEHVENYSREHYDKIFLFVTEDNANAKVFYDKQGYVKVGTVPDMYVTGVTDYLMMKRLK